MTEAQEKTLKVISREIDKLRPEQNWFDRELDIINKGFHSVHETVIARTEPIRVIVPKWNRWKQRFARYHRDFEKFSRKIDALRVRIDRIKEEDAPVEMITAITEKLATIVLDGSHRLEMIAGIYARENSEVIR